MELRQGGRAWDTDYKGALTICVDEALTALAEAYFDLTDEAFWAHPVEFRHNIVSIVMHTLQQHDDFNSNLQERRHLEARHGWRFLEPEERFQLWGLPPEKLPKPGDAFPAIEWVKARHDEIQLAILTNLAALTEDDFTQTGVGRWPRLGDIFFRAAFHTQAHIRQIWLLRGVMGLVEPFPQQHYA